jgi:hypothetical protein
MQDTSPIRPGLFAKHLGELGLWQCSRLGGGANNQVFLLEKDGQQRILKHYASTSDRDRYVSEQVFYKWADRVALRQVPEAIAWDNDNRSALLTHVQGNPPPHIVGKAEVEQAAQFILDLNIDRPAARQFPIPQAADTGDCLTQLARVATRIHRLQNLPPDIPLRNELGDFLQNQLLPSWQEISTNLKDAMERVPELANPIPSQKQILSPSDFGFHNSLTKPDGRLTFFDFEYAGWDDPAKMVCDFLRQPRHNIPENLWSAFIESVSQLSEEPAVFLNRIRFLLPLHNLKWCCIFLNEFRPEHFDRRQTASNIDPFNKQTLRAQITKARRHLETFNPDNIEAWPT